MSKHLGCSMSRLDTSLIQRNAPPSLIALHVLPCGVPQAVPSHTVIKLVEFKAGAICVLNEGLDGCLMGKQ